MIINIGRKMRQELEEAGTRRPGAGLGLSLDTKEAGLEAELALVWEEMWGRGRLDIAGTKAIARLYTLGGAEWFVTVLVERLLGLVYSADLDRATAAVFSLLHIDLVPCSLALLMHTLPRCLVGEGREQLLVQPRGQVPRAPHRGLPRRQPQQPRQHGLHGPRQHGGPGGHV